MSIYSYISSYFINENNVNNIKYVNNINNSNNDLIKKPEICFNNNDLINQKITLKPSVNKSIGRNIPKHISNLIAEVNQEKNILTQILGVKLKKTKVNLRQVTFLPRNPILLEILVRVPIVH
jgi:hypothetical protein